MAKKISNTELVKKIIKQIIKNPHLWSPAEVAYARMQLRLRKEKKKKK